MKDLNLIVLDPENDRLFQLRDIAVSAYSITTVEKLWSALIEPGLDSPFGIAYLDDRVYVADNRRVLKLSAKDGSKVAEGKLGGFYPRENNHMEIMNGKLILLNDYGAIAVYDLVNLEPIKIIPDRFM